MFVSSFASLCSTGRDFQGWSTSLARAAQGKVLFCRLRVFGMLSSGICLVAANASSIMPH